MSEFFDERETRDPQAREADLFARLPAALARALTFPGWAKHLGAVDAKAVTTRQALAALPVLRKSDLPGLHAAAPPFGGFGPSELSHFGRLFTSPGPIFEGEGTGRDPWRSARALFAAGFRKTDIVLNTFAYHLTPGGFMMDHAARAVGCAVIPAGPGNTEQQFEVIRAFSPTAYAGTPDFLKILLDQADASDRDVSSIRKASVGGAAFPRSLQEAFTARGIEGYQSYGTADVGTVAYETSARDGLVINEDIIVEIVRPGTGDPVDEGEIGEVVVTTLDPDHPVIRIALGDLSAILPGLSPCGRTGQRIKGWLGRADQTAKVKGMFVRPDQIAEIGKRHPELRRLRLVVRRANELDMMELKAETTMSHDDTFVKAVLQTLQSVTKLKGTVELVPLGSLPNDGKVIADERTYT
ncbi:phenylacetate--CoA ligase family protein [Chelatococcus reniformis]|uniref:Phenylacetate--CoA ligase n=1 Tax=Chelatococcus reniformis TaxID=1494448 RepID=A0A916XM86_9HYPH|nr:AMP-binding protein [Chelatococcus reniformis]GGC86367.1 phenylacetate--CoA ligase [Chelatococcus reniformis]